VSGKTRKRSRRIKARRGEQGVSNGPGAAERESQKRITRKKEFLSKLKALEGER